MSVNKDVILEVSYKGAVFSQVEASNEVGRRLITHLYPQTDNTFIEDMGRTARKFNIKGFLSGDDFREKLDKLLQACESKGIGTLIHPTYGTMEVYCNSISVSEKYIDGRNVAQLELNFSEGSDNRFSSVIFNTQQLVRDKGVLAELSYLQKAVKWIEKITALPQTAKDYISNMMQNQLGISPYALLSIMDATQNFLNTDITNSLYFDNLYGYLTSFKLGFLEPLTQSNGRYDDTKFGSSEKITPTQAINTLNTIKNNAKSYTTKAPILGITKNSKTQLEQVKNINRMIMVTAVIEQAICSTYLSFNNVSEAETIWKLVLDNFDEVIEVAAVENDDTAYTILQEMKNYYHQDITKRAPSLGRIMKKSIYSPTPSLVLAWDIYKDINRDGEIVNRNKIKHPGFISGHNLEFIDK